MQIGIGISVSLPRAGGAGTASEPDPEAPAIVSTPVIEVEGGGPPVVGAWIRVVSPGVYTGYPEPDVTWRWQVRDTPAANPAGLLGRGRVERYQITEAVLGRYINTQSFAENPSGNVGFAQGTSNFIGPIEAAAP